VREVKKDGSGGAVGRGGLSDPGIGREGPEPGVGLAVAIRAEQNALRELSLDLLPATRDPIDGNPEFLGVRIEMVKLERVDRRFEATTATRPPSAATHLSFAFWRDRTTAWPLFVFMRAWRAR
jgi:hypothetical protein